MGRRPCGRVPRAAAATLPLSARSEGLDSGVTIHSAAAALQDQRAVVLPSRPCPSSFVLGARQDDAGWDARDELPVGRRGAMGWRRLRRISRLVLKKLDGIFLSSHFYSLTLTHNAQRNTHGQRRRRCRARACRPAPLLPARSLPTTPPSRTRLSCPRHHTGTSKSWTRWTR